MIFGEGVRANVRHVAGTFDRTRNVWDTLLQLRCFKSMRVSGYRNTRNVSDACSGYGASNHGEFQTSIALGNCRTFGSGNCFYRSGVDILTKELREARVKDHLQGDHVVGISDSSQTVSRR